MPRNYPEMKIQFYEDAKGQKINVKNAELLWGGFRNFGGRATEYKKEGEERYFNIAIPEEYIPMFNEQGIDVGYWKNPKDENEDTSEVHFVKVKVNFDYWEKPTISVKEGEDGQWVDFDEGELKELDQTAFDKVGLILKVSRGVTRFGKPYTSLYLASGLFVKHVNEPNTYEQDMYSTFGYKPRKRVYGAVSETQPDEELPFVE